MPHIPPAYARVVMTQLLIDRNIFNFEKHHHYLGLNAGPKLEIPPLLAMKALDTIDSSGPVWAAILNHRYSHETDSFQSVSKIKLPVDFNISKSKDADTDHRILHNITLTRDLFNKIGDSGVWYAED